MAMGTPKKPLNKKVEPIDDDDENMTDQPKKKVIDEDDDDFDGPLDDIGFENLDDYDEDEDEDF